MDLSDVRRVIDSAKNPVLLCSFGKESLVLLKLAKEIKPDIPILWFRDSMNPFAEKIIKEWSLEVLGYAPTIRYRVENTLVSEYAIGSARLPLLQDISAHGKPIGYAITPQFDYQWDVTLFGYRKTDNHPLVNQTFEREFQLGSTRMIAPLYDLSDEDIFNLIDEMEIPYESYCDDVLMPDVPVVPIETFRTRFGFN